MFPPCLRAPPSSKMPSLYLFFAITLLPLMLQADETNFFARQVHPLEMTEDGSRLLALNSAEGRLSIFAMEDEEMARPILIQEIFVGLLPVSVRLRTADEAWVVNELSDSISVVSLSRGRVVATYGTGNEPADVVFAGGKAFVTCARDGTIEVYQPSDGTLLSVIPVKGLMPRMLAVSADGERVHAAFLHTSNGTTILPRTEAPPQQVSTMNTPELPRPPRVGKVVPVSDERISYEVLDHDVVTLSVEREEVLGYEGEIGTNILALCALQDGSLLAANSEARNLIALEPELRGRFVRSRLARLTGNGLTQFDLNRDPDVSFPEIDSGAAAVALAQVMAILPEERFAWLAAFGSDRLAQFDLEEGKVIRLIDLRQKDDEERSGRTVRGPRGMAKHPKLPRLFVLNRLSHTLTTLDPETGMVLAEIPLSQHLNLSEEDLLGRGFLFDARLSGNGSVSCASCHIDLEQDGMAWDLGDPRGEMKTVLGAQLSIHRPETFVERRLHPMKGPMMTQTLIGLATQEKLHWRGDMERIQDFNITFPNLLAAPLLPDEEMDLVARYLQKLKHHPNPNLELDRSLREDVAGGDPRAGISVFTAPENHCATCHTLPTGTSNNLGIFSSVGSFQPLKDAPLQTTYQRTHFNPRVGAQSVSGFGLGSDGSHFELPISHPYSLHNMDDVNRRLAVRQKEKRDLTAFILSFDTGTAPAIGHTVTITAKKLEDEQRARIRTLEQQAGLGALSGVSLVVQGFFRGEKVSWRYDRESETYEQVGRTLDLIVEEMEMGDVLSFLGVPLDSEGRFTTDRDGDGQEDGSAALPSLQLPSAGILRWEAQNHNFYPEYSNDARAWKPLPREIKQTRGSYHFEDPPTIGRRFYRLRRR